MPQTHKNFIARGGSRGMPGHTLCVVSGRFCAVARVKGGTRVHKCELEDEQLLGKLGISCSMD